MMLKRTDINHETDISHGKDYPAIGPELYEVLNDSKTRGDEMTTSQAWIS
jgi:tryptophan synthase beta subunit